MVKLSNILFFTSFSSSEISLCSWTIWNLWCSKCTNLYFHTANHRTNTSTLFEERRSHIISSKLYKLFKGARSLSLFIERLIISKISQAFNILSFTCLHNISALYLRSAQSVKHDLSHLIFHSFLILYESSVRFNVF